MSRSIWVTFFGVFIIYYGLLCFRSQWGGDFQMYASGAARLYADLVNPGHETLDLPTYQSSLYTPYLVLVSAMGRLAGVTPYRALQVAGLMNLLIYALAIRALFSRYSIHFRYGLPAALFLFATLVLRWEHFGWSSETSLTNFQYVQAYPSTLGWSLALFAFALVEDLRRRQTWQSFGLLTLALTALLTIHVLTASWALGIVALLALYADLARRRLGLLIPVSGAAGCSVLLASLWPYASFFGQTSVTAIQEPSIFGRAPFHDMLNLYIVALPCALWLVLRVRRHGVWLCGFAASYAMLLLWRALELSFGNRYSFFMGFFAQLLVAEAAAVGVLSLFGGRVSLRVDFKPQEQDSLLAATFALAVVLAPLPSPMLRHARDETSFAALRSPAELLKLPSPHDQYYQKYAQLEHYLGPEDIIIAPTSREVFDIAAVTGAKFISSPGAIRVHDLRDRAEAAAHYFWRGATPSARAVIAARYSATKVLLPRHLFGLAPDMQAVLGPPIYHDPHLLLFQNAVTPR